MYISLVLTVFKMCICVIGQDLVATCVEAVTVVGTEKVNLY